MNLRSDQALIMLSVPANLLYPPRRVRRMPVRYGDWKVEISGISIDECRVKFDSKGSLVIDVPDSTAIDAITILRNLSMGWETAFRGCRVASCIPTLESARRCRMTVPTSLGGRASSAHPDQVLDELVLREYS